MGLSVAGAEADAEPRKRTRWDAAPARRGVENTPLHLLEPKDDRYGFGYDRFRGAEAFRRAWQARQAPADTPPPRTGAPHSSPGRALPVAR